MWNLFVKLRNNAQHQSHDNPAWKESFDQGVACIRQNKLDEALKHLDTALTLTQSPIDLEKIYLQKAATLFYNSNKDAALEECNNALKCNKFSNRAILNKAIIKKLDVEKTAKLLIGATVNSLDDLLAKAKAYELLGKPNEALKSYKAALKKGDDAEIHYGIGVLLLTANKYHEAKKEFLKATKLCDNYIFALEHLKEIHKIDEKHIPDWHAYDHPEEPNERGCCGRMFTNFHLDVSDGTLGLIE